MEQVRSVIRKAVAAMNEDDPDTFCSFLSENAIMFPPTEPPKTGKKLHDWMFDFLNRFRVNFDRYEDVEIRIANNLALNHYFFIWTVTPKPKGEPFVRQGHGIRILAKEPGGSWKISREIWSMYPAPE